MSFTLTDDPHVLLINVFKQYFVDQLVLFKQQDDNFF